MSTKDIRKTLNALGISKSVVGATSVDGSPAVLLRWNGREEYVTNSYVPDEMGRTALPEEATDALVKNWADTNLPDA